MKVWIGLALVVVVFSLVENQRKSGKQNNKLETEQLMVSDSVSESGTDVMNWVEAKEAALSYFTTKMSEDTTSKDWTYIYESAQNRLPIEMKYGNVFSSQHKHLQLSFSEGNKNQYFYYKIDASSLQEVLQWTEDDSKVVRFRDINGDGEKDRTEKDVLNTKNELKVQIFIPETGLFSNPISLSNPCINVKEGVVRGYTASFPADTVYYKLAWKNAELDTLELLYPHPQNSAWFIKSKKILTTVTDSSGIPLWFLPKEYKSLDECLSI